MGNVLIALPLYRTVTTEWLFNFLSADRTQCVGNVAVKNVPTSEAMKTLVDLAFSNFTDRWDRLVVWEHDMIVPDNVLNRIANYGPEYDIVGSLYFNHEPPHAPYVYMQVDETGFAPIAPASVQHIVANPAIYPVSAVGFGFTSISRRVLEQWGKSINMFRPDPATGIGSHDLWFCLKAREQGFSVGVDSGIVCGHLSQVSIGLADHQRYPVDAGVSIVPIVR